MSGQNVADVDVGTQDRVFFAVGVNPPHRLFSEMVEV